MELYVYCDGGARGNPGPAAVGVAIKQGDTDLPVSTLIKLNKYLGRATNNQAEYQAVVHALEWITDNLKNLVQIPEKIRFFLDSTLVVNQLNGQYKLKNAGLRELLLKVRNLEQKINLPIVYSYIPREKNTEADNLVNEALDKQC